MLSDMISVSSEIQINTNHLELTIGERHDFIMDVSADGRRLHLLVTGWNAPVANVFPDGVVEQHRILRYHPDVSTQRRLLHLHETRIWAHDLTIRGLDALQLTLEMSWPSMRMQPPWMS